MKPPESLAQTEKSTEGKLPVSSPESVRRYVVTLLRRNRGLFLALVALNSVAAAASIVGPQVLGGLVEKIDKGSADYAYVNQAALIFLVRAARADGLHPLGPNPRRRARRVHPRRPPRRLPHPRRRAAARRRRAGRNRRPRHPDHHRRRPALLGGPARGSGDRHRVGHRDAGLRGPGPDLANTRCLMALRGTDHRGGHALVLQARSLRLPPRDVLVRGGQRGHRRDCRRRPNRRGLPAG